MYRIIGVNSNGQLKLIKKEALNSTMKWCNSYSADFPWRSSTIYSNINGSSFLSNSSYVPSGWSSKIADSSWKYGDMKNYNTTAANLYSIENAWTSTVSAKIGLWYLHDYYYGLSGGNNCSANPSTCGTSWIYIDNNDSSDPGSGYEWTMSRYDYSIYDGTYRALHVYAGGYVNGGSYMNESFSVRPVFYLTSEVEIVSGTGTIEDPIIIN